MKKLLVFTTICSYQLFAPEFEENTTIPKTKTTSIFNKAEQQFQKINPHEPVKAFDNRTHFEQAIKTRNLENAQSIFKQIQNSPMTTEEFVKPLVDRYNNVRDKVTDLYTGRSNDSARDQLMQDLIFINPHLAKIFRDSFKVQTKTSQSQSRIDDAYFNHLNENPEQITMPYALHEPTPFEIAVTTENKEMANRIVALAQKHKISPTHIVDPLVNEYKKIMKTQGKKAAHAFAQKIYDLKIERVSEIFYNKIQKLHFT